MEDLLRIPRQLSKRWKQFVVDKIWYCPAKPSVGQKYSAQCFFVRNFWDIVHNFDEDQKKLLLQFTTGSDRVPIGGLAKLKLIIARNGPDSDRYKKTFNYFSNFQIFSITACKNMLYSPNAVSFHFQVTNVSYVLQCPTAPWLFEQREVEGTLTKGSHPCQRFWYAVNSRFWIFFATALW